MSEFVMQKLKKKVFGILDDYDIENIILNIISSTNDYLLDEFLMEYHKKYDGNIKVHSINL